MTGTRSLCFLFALCACAFAGEQSDVELLAKVRIHMVENLHRLPNYTCLQTIERSQRRAPSRRQELIDTVRLEVALVNGKELFAWPGERTFQEKDINQMVTGGAIGNGSFAIHAKSVFESRAPRFTFIGEQLRDGRKTLRWDFEVARIRSGYLIRVGAREAIVGYHGSFWVDAETLDLMRLEVVPENIPPELQLAAASDSMNYMRAKIGDSTFLLPQSSELRMTDSNNSDSVNRTSFSKCRQYTGESVLSFGDPADLDKPKLTIRQVDIPAGLLLEAATETPIDSANTAVGDPVTAIVTRTMKKDGVELAPKGAVLHGRVTLLRRQNLERTAFVVGIRFQDMEAPGIHASLNLELQDVMASGNIVMIPGALRTGSRWAMGTAMPQLDREVFGSVFFVRGSEFRLPRGLHLLWRTAAVKPEDPPQ